MASNVFCKDGKWYYRIEDENIEGPFDSAYEAETMLIEYAFHIYFGNSKAAHSFRSLLIDIAVLLRYGNEADKKEITEIAVILADLLKRSE